MRAGGQARREKKVQGAALKRPRGRDEGGEEGAANVVQGAKLVVREPRWHHQQAAERLYRPEEKQRRRGG